MFVGAIRGGGGALRADQKQRVGLLVWSSAGDAETTAVALSLIFFIFFDVAVICVYAGVVSACMRVCMRVGGYSGVCGPL